MPPQGVEGTTKKGVVALLPFLCCCAMTLCVHICETQNGRKKQLSLYLLSGGGRIILYTYTFTYLDNTACCYSCFFSPLHPNILGNKTFVAMFAIDRFLIAKKSHSRLYNMSSIWRKQRNCNK